MTRTYSRLKHSIRSLLTLSALCALPSACGPALDPPAGTHPGFSPTMAFSITLADEQDVPISGLTLAYSLVNGATGGTDWKGARTDASGSIKTSCTSLCEVEIQAEGYWPYKGPYLDPARIQLAARSSEERSGKQLRLSDYELFRSHLGSQPGNSEIQSFASLLGTDTKTRQSSFQVRNSAELEPILSQLARIDSGTATQPGKAAGNFPTEAPDLMRKALAEGKRLVGYSSNVFLRYTPMVEALHQTADSYYFSENRTRLLTEPGQSRHTYDYELIVYALPADGKKVVFDSSEGRLELKP